MVFMGGRSLLTIIPAGANHNARSILAQHVGEIVLPVRSIPFGLDASGNAIGEGGNDLSIHGVI